MNQPDPAATGLNDIRLRVLQESQDQKTPEQRAADEAELAHYVQAMIGNRIALAEKPKGKSPAKPKLKIHDLNALLPKK